MAKKIFITAQELAEAAGGQILSGSGKQRLEKFSTDTRTLKPGTLFFALVGPNYDAHQFLAKALEQKIAGAVISKETTWVKIKKGKEVAPGDALEPLIILVPDTEKALGQAARLWRQKHPLPLVAITGSNGKTTTKEMLAHILRPQYSLHASSGNFNNLVGVPLTLFALNRQHQMAVLELGMNAPGEIAQLCQIAQPQVGVITNISGAHLEFLKDVEGVARAKGELMDYINQQKEKGTMILNADDPYLQPLISSARCSLVTFGLGSGCDFQATEIQSHDPGANGRPSTRFTIRCAGESKEIHLPLPGRHNVYNALAAAAAASRLGVTLSEVKTALKNFTAPPLRSQIYHLARGVKIYNDAYNANPRSMETAIRTLVELGGSDPKLLVLGDMLELGPQSPGLHETLGRTIAGLPITLLIAVGPMGQHLVQGALAAGMDAGRILHFQKSEEVQAPLRAQLVPRSWVLVKGSRGMKMEKILEGLE